MKPRDRDATRAPNLPKLLALGLAVLGLSAFFWAMFLWGGLAEGLGNALLQYWLFAAILVLAAFEFLRELLLIWWPGDPRGRE